MISFRERITNISQDIKPDTCLWLSQILKFGTVGLLNTSVDWLAYFILTRTVGYLDANPFLAKGLSFTLGIATSYLFNRNWTFRSQSSTKRSMSYFAVINLLAIPLNSLTLQIGMETLHLPEGYALLLATSSTFVWNFLWSKFYIFKN